MDEKKRQKWQEGMAPILEPEERVVAGTYGQDAVPTWGLIVMVLVFIPALIWPAFRGRHVILTDRNVYVTKAGLSVWKASTVLAKHPLGTVQAYAKGGFSPELVVGNEKIFVGWAHSKGAQAIADGVNSAAAAVPQQSGEGTAGAG